MSVRLERKKGHVPSARITRRPPTVPWLSSIQDSKRDEGTGAEAPRLLPDPTELFVHRDVAITASEEFGPKGEPTFGRKVFVQKSDKVDVSGRITEKLPWKRPDKPCFRVVLTVHLRDFG